MPPAPGGESGRDNSSLNFTRVLTCTVNGSPCIQTMCAWEEKDGRSFFSQAIMGMSGDAATLNRASKCSASILYKTHIMILFK